MNIKLNWVSENPKKTGLMITIFVLIFSLLTVDRILHFITPEKPSNEPGIVRAINLREHHPGQSRIFNPDEKYLVNTTTLLDQDYPLRIDNNGFILPHNNHDNPDKKIFFIGGSTIECLYVNENNRFPVLVEQIIEEKTGKFINVYNAGFSGNSSIHSLDILLNKIIPMDPDVIVISHAMNDWAILAFDQTYWPVGTSRSELITINDYFPNIKEESFIGYIKGMIRLVFPHIYQKLFEIKEKIINQSINDKEIDEWAGRRHLLQNRDLDFMQKQFRWALQLLVVTAKTYDIQLVLMTQANRFKESPDEGIIESMAPVLNSGITYEVFKEEYDIFNDIVRDIAKINEIPLIDLATLVPQDKEYMYDVMHYNDNGSKFVSKIIAEKLIDFMSDL